MNSSIRALLCLIAALPSARAATVILGDTSGNSRGADSVDIQSTRFDPTLVAGGQKSIAFGVDNLSSGISSIAIGNNNYTDGDEATSVGQYNFASEYAGVAVGYGNIVTEADSTGVGSYNEVRGLGHAFGYYNLVSSDGLSSNWLTYEPSGAFGAENTITTPAKGSFAFGRYNILNALNSTAFGIGITNSTAGSTMIGPSNAAKVTILSSGNVGIGTAAPSSKLHVVGDINVTGSIINPMLSSSGSGSTSRMRVGGTTTPSAAWQGTAVVGADGQNKIITGYLASSTNGAVIGAHNSALTGWADLNVAGANLIFRTSETERMRINAAGDVGIGISSPSAKLEVAGKIYAKTAVGQTFFHGHQVGTSYSNSQPIFTAQSDNSNGAQNFYFRGMAGGVTTAEIRADGRSYFAGDVGFGTNGLSGGIDDATNNNAIKGKLQIFANGTDATALFIKGNSTEYAGLKIKVGPGNTSGAPDYYDITVRPSYNAGVNTGPDVSAIRINNTKPRTRPDVLINRGGGNVGIGTDNPSTQLTIQGSDPLVDAVAPSDTLTVNASSAPGLRMSANANGGISSYFTGSVASVHTTANTTGIYPFNEAGNLIIQSRAAGAGRDIVLATGIPTTERMVVTRSGNVGVGTITPTVRLDVVGDAKISGSLTVGGSPVLTSIANGGGLTGLNASQVTAGILPAARLPSEVVQLTSIQTLTNKTLSGAKLVGATAIGGGSIGNQMVVTSGGAVGLGRNPDAGVQLDVNGEAVFRSGINVSGGLTSDGAFINYGNAGVLEQVGLSDLWLGGGETLSLAAGSALHLVSQDIRIGIDYGYETRLIPEGDSATYQNLRIKPYGTGAVIVEGKTELQGSVVVSANITVKNNAVIRVSPAGDIGMGAFMSGSNPAN